MEILTAGQMQRVDRRAIDDYGIPATTLMDNAGREVAEALLRYCDAAARRILILCGRGNNGGDGMTAARHLAVKGVRARVALLGAAADLAGEAAWAFASARSGGIEIEEISGDAEWSALRAVLPEHDLVVDALLGTGASGAARGRTLEAIHAMNASGCRIVSIDIPSGLHGSSAEPPGPCVEADLTLALAALKVPHAFPPACRFAGRLEVLDIGIPRAALESERTQLHWADGAMVAALLPRRDAATHKGLLGHVLIVAGSRGKSGAAVLMARGCLRSGAGLVTVATPASAQAVVAACVPEAMTEPLPETADGELAASALPGLLALAGTRDVLALGPGLGTGEQTAQVVTALITLAERPLVLDADALNIMAAAGAKPAGDPRRTVLTPHPGEAARLLRTTAASIQADRLAAVRTIASTWNGAALLKGYRSLIADPEGTVRVNPTGNPGMATGGSGDVLAGMIAAWLGQGLAAADAAMVAAHAHGLAGDMAAEITGEIALTAGDIVEFLPHAYRDLADARCR